MQLPDADFAYRLCRNLADAGHTVHVLCQKGAIAGDVPRLHTHPIMEQWNWQETVPLARTLRRLKPEATLLVYTGNAFDHRPMLTFAATLAKRVLPHTRFVTLIPFPLGARLSTGKKGHLHKLLLKMLGQGTNVEYGTLLRDSAHVVVMSLRHLPALESHLPRLQDKVTLIPPALIMPMALDTCETRSRMREALHVADDEFLFAYFGYLYATKGLETLLPALHILRQRNQKVKLMFVGGGDQTKDDGYQYVAELKRTIDTLQLTDAVQFTGGFAWDSDLGSQYLRAADAAVLPFDAGVSLNNSSFASVVTHGLPTITTQGDILEAPLKHAQNVFLCRPQDPDDLADALETVAGNTSLRQQLQSGARQLAGECFSWDAATTRYVSVLAGEKQ